MTMLERVARAIMLDDGCGFTLNEARVFCDNPGLPDEARGGRCGCKCAARAAIEAMLPSGPLPPDVIAAAWAAWHSRHGGKLGPGPAFVEAIEAAIAKLTALSEGKEGK